MDQSPLETQYLRVDGQPVVSLAEFQSYTYGLPEAAVVPETLSRWLTSGDIEAAALSRCLHGEATIAAGDSDESLEVVRLILERMQRSSEDPSLDG